MIFSDRPLTRPLAVLNRNCQFKKRYDIACDLKDGEIRGGLVFTNKLPRVNNKIGSSYYNNEEVLERYKEYQKEYQQSPKFKQWAKEYQKNNRDKINAQRRKNYQIKKHLKRAKSI